MERLASNGLRLAVLTNSVVSAEQVKRRFERLGLAGYFAAILPSCDLGHVLPEPAAFHALLDRINVAAPSVAYVSCCPWELAAAAEAHLTAIAVRIAPERQDVLVVEQLSELATTLADRPARPLAA